MSAVAAVTLLATVPLGVAEDNETGIGFEDLLLDEGSTWSLVDEGPPLAVRAAGRPDLSPDPVAIRVEGIDTFGFVTKVKSGTLEVLVDGVVVATLGRGTHTEDIPLTPDPHEIAWRYVPALVDEVVDLALHGAVALLPPSLRWATQQMWSWCGGEPHFGLSFVFSLLVARADIRLTYNGEEANVSVWSWVNGMERHHYVRFSPPPAPDGTPGVVNATLTDATGRVWNLVTDLATKTRDHTPMSLYPEGWVYDLRPTVHAFSPCGYERPVKLQLFVDGVDRTSPESEGIWSSYTFDHDLPFGETHTAKMVVTHANGSVVTEEVEFREGLDVMEFDVERLALVFGETYVSTPTTAFGEGVFGNALGPHELPPIVEDLRGALDHDPSQPWLWPDGAHLRAVYTPLGILCPEVSTKRIVVEVTCSPYDADAPGFRDEIVKVAELTVTGRDGNATVIPAAGQWAAASRLTVDVAGRLS